MIGFVLSYLLGVISGILIEYYVKPLAFFWLDLVGYKVKRSVLGAPKVSDHGTVVLGKHDTHVAVVLGDGVKPIPLDNIVLSYSSNQVVVENSSIVNPLIQEVEEDVNSKRQSGLDAPWDGTTAHLNRFVASFTPDNEDYSLELYFDKGRFFHFMATTARLHNEFAENGFDSKLRKQLIGDFNEWRVSTPPNVLVGLAVGMFLITIDNYIVFSRRSQNVAIAPGECSCTINENLHLEHDMDHVTGKLSISSLIERGVCKESGHELEQGDHVFVLAFTADVARVAYGLFGYVRLAISSGDLRRKFAAIAPERRETRTFEFVKFDVKSVTEFVCDEKLYNATGVLAAYTLMHARNVKFETIEEWMLRRQKVA